MSALTAKPALTDRDVLLASEVAKLLRLPVGTVHDYARRGILPSQKLGRHRRFIRSEVEAVMRGEPISDRG